MSSPDVIREFLTDGEFEFEEPAEGHFVVDLPGEKKLKTTVHLELGRHGLTVKAFVCRRPDENFEGVYRWLLERNRRMYGVAFGIDGLGDIYLDGRFPAEVVTSDELDRLLGSVLTYADESFNVLLGLGFASSIRKEWEWRLANGESTRNLEAFESLRPQS